MKRKYEGRLSEQSSLSINEKGNVIAWGDNKDGQLGLGDIQYQYEPVELASLKNIKEIIARYESVFFLDADGQVYACGCNEDGQLGVGDIKWQRTPALLNLQDIEQIIQISSSTFFINMKGQVFVCGSNEYGRLGTWSTEDVCDEVYPILIESLENIKQVVSNGFSTFFLNNKGEVFACGDNENDRLGTGNTDDYEEVPIQLTHFKNIEEMAYDGTNIYFHDSNGQVISYGEDEDMQFSFKKDVEQQTLLIFADQKNRTYVKIRKSSNFFPTSDSQLVEQLENCQISEQNPINSSMKYS